MAPTAIFLSLTLALKFSLPTAGFLPSYSIPSPIYSNRHDLTHQSTKYTSKRSIHLSAALRYLDDSNMNDLLFRPNGDQPRSVLVDAYAVWCGPCKLIEPFLLRLATIHSFKLSILKYDVESPDTKNLKVEMLLQGVRVQGLPTLILYHDGRPLATHSGAISEEGLDAWIDENLFSKLDADGDYIVDLVSGNGLKSKENGGKSDGDKKSGETKRGKISLTSQFGRDDYMLSNE